MDELEAKLIGCQWVGGHQQPTSLDKIALEQVQQCLDILDPKMYPNTFGWYSLVSKFSMDMQKKWPSKK